MIIVPHNSTKWCWDWSRNIRLK